MREKLLLLHDDADGKALCDAASRVLTQIAVAFGHTFVLSVRACDGADAQADDALLDACGEARAVIVGSERLTCLPALAQELLCAYRVRELRYAHLIENRSLMGERGDLRFVAVQALSPALPALREAAKEAYRLSREEDLPILQTPPTGRLAEDWRVAADAADSLQAPYHARHVPLPELLPYLIANPARAGVVLCPPYAGSVVLPAASALCGAPGMGYDRYGGGQCAVFAALDQLDDRHGSELNPFGLLRALHTLLRDVLDMPREADCLEAALRNVLQAGWRTADIALPTSLKIDINGVSGLLCQQIEVAGEWIKQ